MSNRSKMPGLRLKGGIWHIEKRCKEADGGWLRESTGTSSRREAENVLINRLAEIKAKVERNDQGIYTFEEAALRYLEEVAHKASAGAIAIHLDQLFPFLGQRVLEQIHDGTMKTFIDYELTRGKSPKSINNAIAVVSAILNRAARRWRDEEGKPWLKYAPPRITRLSLVGKQAKAYPLTWAEQDCLIQELPRHLADAALFTVNTGCRDQEVCQLSWAWEVKVPELDTSVFILPETITKTNTERVVVLNSVAKRVVDAQRGNHPSAVFTYKQKPIARLHNSAWKRAWRASGLPVEPGIRRGVHSLRHTFGRRLRGVGVPLETRKVLLGHASGDITTHYSAVELKELLDAAEKIVDRGVAQTPTLTVIRQTNPGVGKVSEKEKRVSSY
jgi:integrase